VKRIIFPPCPTIFNPFSLLKIFINNTLNI
jgi:hypothetical protein